MGRETASADRKRFNRARGRYANCEFSRAGPASLQPVGTSALARSHACRHRAREEGQPGKPVYSAGTAFGAAENGSLAAWRRRRQALYPAGHGGYFSITTFHGPSA